VTSIKPINSPAKFQAARQRLGVSQVRLAELLGRSERSIRDYETEPDTIDRCVDLAMRYLLITRT